MKFLLLLLLALPAAAEPSAFGLKLAQTAEAQAQGKTRYDPSYVRLKYPGGEPPVGQGVCTDVVGRAYKALGVDLQKEVHEDMKAHFSAYPKRWGRREPDANIDHRRVPNLMTFFRRRGGEVAVSAAYEPGDLVVWDLGGGVLHIGLVARGGKVAHHIGGMGPVVEDVLRAWKIVGHFRYAP